MKLLKLNFCRTPLPKRPQYFKLIITLQVQFQIIQCFALHQVKIVGLTENSVLEAPAQSLEITIVDIKKMTLHVFNTTTRMPPSNQRYN